MAGGLLPTAALRHIEVQRLVAHEKQTMLSLDIPDTGDARGSDQETRIVSKFRTATASASIPIAPYNQDAVYLEGHVVRPGRYSYREDMRVTDVIASYKDLLPEPATQYAEIIRLNPPDFHPSVRASIWPTALANPVAGAGSAAHGYGAHLQPIRFRKSADGFGLGRRARAGDLPDVGTDSFAPMRFTWREALRRTRRRGCAGVPVSAGRQIQRSSA